MQPGDVEVMQADYGWYLVKSDGTLAEPLTAQLRVKHYKSKPKAEKRARQMQQYTHSPSK